MSARSASLEGRRAAAQTAAPPPPAQALTALQDGFLRTDAELLRRAAAPPRRKGFDAGTAAVCMMVTDRALAMAHAGDCRAILDRDGDKTWLWSRRCAPAANQIAPQQLHRRQRRFARVRLFFLKKKNRGA